MIKINLALKKQGGVGTVESNSIKSFKLGSLDLDKFKELPIRKVVLPILVGFLASYLLDTHKEEELKKVNAFIEKLNQEGKFLQEQANKFKETDKVKKALDEDELIIKTKLDTIKHLVKDRSDASKVLISFSNTIPSDVWLSELKVFKSDIQVRGSSLGFSQVSDFMKNLEETSLYSSVELRNSKQAKKGTWAAGAEFELAVKRR